MHTHLCVLLQRQRLRPAADHDGHGPGAAKVHQHSLVATRHLWTCARVCVLLCVARAAGATAPLQHAPGACKPCCCSGGVPPVHQHAQCVPAHRHDTHQAHDGFHVPCQPRCLPVHASISTPMPVAITVPPPAALLAGPCCCRGRRGRRRHGPRRRTRLLLLLLLPPRPAGPLYEHVVGLHVHVRIAPAVHVADAGAELQHVMMVVLAHAWCVVACTRP
jgi:hypothetical protein